MFNRTIAVSVLAWALAVSASAVEKGQIGLAASASDTSELGAIWHVSRHVAVIPALGLRFHQTGDPYCVAGECPSGSENNLRLGLGVRCYLTPSRPMTPYLGTRLDTAGHDNRWTTAAGLHYAVSKRVSVFGEMGVGYHWGWARVSRFRSVDAWEVGTYTSSIGAVLYLN